MKRRFTKLPIASIAIVIGCLLVGLSMGPVDAQSALTNGMVTIRSDGAVYLITNGVRRWVATVVITDEELNAYPEAEPIYSGLAPFGAAAASPSPASAGTGTAATTNPTGATAATKTSGATAATKTTGSTGPGASSSGSSGNQGTGGAIVDASSGADAKDPNDPTLAEATTSADSSAKAAPTGKTTCPSTHQIKGGFDKYYWDTDRADYAAVEPEACFVSGAYAREFGYTEVKKRPAGGSSTSR